MATQTNPIGASTSANTTSSNINYASCGQLINLKKHEEERLFNTY
jgi:hypothetical protein